MPTDSEEPSDYPDEEDVTAAREAENALRQFQARFRPRPPSPEEEAALGAAIEIGNIETGGSKSP
jgi:hypothetical protein